MAGRSSIIACGAFAAIAAWAAANVSLGQTQPCTWETAEHVSLISLARSGDRLLGRCVRTYGDLNGRDLSRELPNTDVAIIGAYFDDERTRGSFLDRPRRTHVVGTIAHCRDICADAGPDEICMAIGYCHYYDDIYINIEDVR